MEYVADNGYPTVMTAKDVDRVVKVTDGTAEATDRIQSDG